MARGAPCKACTVRSMRSSRDWVMTISVTSSGMRFSSMRRRTKSKSVCEAAGKPTSISLKPMRTSSSKSRILRSPFIGSKSAWLPSRRSVESQIGARVMERDGQVRSGREAMAVGWYLVAGLAIIMMGSTKRYRAGPASPRGQGGRQRPPRRDQINERKRRSDIPCSPPRGWRLVRGPGSGEGRCCADWRHGAGSAGNGDGERRQTPARH